MLMATFSTSPRFGVGPPRYFYFIRKGSLLQYAVQRLVALSMAAPEVAVAVVVTQAYCSTIQYASKSCTRQLCHMNRSQALLT